MGKNIRLKRLIEYLKTAGHIKSQKEFAERTARNVSVVSEIVNGKRKASEHFIRTVCTVFPFVSYKWITDGEGEMVVVDTDYCYPAQSSFAAESAGEYSHSDARKLCGECVWWAYLIPQPDKGRPIFSYDRDTLEREAKKVPVTVEGIDVAMIVSGDSMYPTFPNGAIVWLSKLRNQTIIEWGEAYVVDTVNGPMIKKLNPADEPDPEYGMDYFHCFSENPDALYKPFRIPLKDILCIYIIRKIIRG